MIQKLNDLKTLPLVLTRILEVSGDPNSSASDLGKVITQDLSISSMVLKVVNSAFYGRTRCVSSIAQAIVILGFQTVKALAMSVSVFKAPKGSSASLDRNRFWVHAAGVATITQLLHQQSSNKEWLSRDEAYLCGLMHDVGKVVFDNYFTEEYRAVVINAKTENHWIGTYEQEMLDMTHSEAGYYLAEKWKFPASVVAAIRYHHSPSVSNSPDAVAVALAHIADHLCREISLGYGGDEQRIPLNSKMIPIAGVSAASMKKVALEVDSMREEIEAIGLDC